MNEIVKVPKIRFPQFTDAWEQRKLSDISDVRDGTHDSPSYLSEGHPFVTSKNVKEGYINYDDIQYISDEDFEAINTRSKVDINDILMGMIGTIGNLALIRTEPDFAIKNVALIKDTKQVSYMYLYHYLQSPSTERQLLSGLDGGTQKFVSLKNIRELSIMVPSEAEQIKVGGFIEAIDNLITLHQRKFVKTKECKKELIQLMSVWECLRMNLRITETVCFIKAYGLAERGVSYAIRNANPDRKPHPGGQPCVVPGIGAFVHRTEYEFSGVSGAIPGVHGCA